MEKKKVKKYLTAEEIARKEEEFFTRLTQGTLVYHLEKLIQKEREDEKKKREEGSI